MREYGRERMWNVPEHDQNGREFFDMGGNVGIWARSHPNGPEANHHHKRQPNNMDYSIPPIQGPFQSASSSTARKEPRVSKKQKRKKQSFAEASGDRCGRVS